MAERRRASRVWRSLLRSLLCPGRNLTGARELSLHRVGAEPERAVGRVQSRDDGVRSSRGSVTIPMGIESFARATPLRGVQFLVTNHSPRPKIHHQLAQAIAANPSQFVFVLGAGVTLGAVAGTEVAAHASWGGLIQHGLRTAVDFGRLDQADADRLAALLDSNNPGLWIGAAQQLSDALGAPLGGEFARWLRESVGSFEQNIVNRSVLDPIRDFAKMGVTLATVNYDGVLEAVTEQPAVTWTERAKAERVLRGEAHGVLHLHGHWEKPESIVLGTSSYDAVVRDEHARTALEAMRMLRTFVFIGHGAGLADPNWGSFLDWTERVFWQSETHNYRIAREAELDALHEPRNQARRLVLVPYEGGYENLGPFLQEIYGHARAAMLGPSRSSAIASPSSEMASNLPQGTPPSIEALAASAPEVELPLIGLDDDREYVLLLLNIGERGYDFVTRQQVTKHGRIAGISITHEIHRVLDLSKANAGHWREIAKEVDGLVADAQQTALESKRPVCFVVAGRAPLPVFSYLGYKLKRTTGQILFVNHRGGEHWERIGPFSDSSDFPDLSRQRFEFEIPRRLDPSGSITVLHVGCSKNYRCNDDLLCEVTTARRRTLSGLYPITTTDDHERTPMGEEDLTALFERISEAMDAVAADLPSYDRLALALGGPAWVAFWVGRRLNKNVQGIIEFANFVPGRGYVPALASQMWRELRVAGDPNVLLIAAEPHDHSRTRAAAALNAIKSAIVREQGDRVIQSVRDIGAMRTTELLRELDKARPDILHISAHGGEDGRLALEDERGEVREIEAGTFVATLRACKIRPSLIVVTACYSGELSDALLGIADCVITGVGKTPYQSSVPFCRGFYGSLARGNSVATAFDQGLQTAKAEFDDKRTHFQLGSRDDVEPDDVVFWEQRRED